MKVSVVIPVYNEAATIGEIVKRVKAIALDKEIIVVDDGSTDGTAEILREMKEGKNVRIIFQKRNQGKGAALRKGFQKASGEFIIVQDADLEYDPRDYHLLLKPLLSGQADVVYGSRFLSGPHRVLYFWHYQGNRFLTFLANLLNDLNLSDMETGYKAFRREVLSQIILKSNRFGFEPEFTAKIARKKFRIYEVPISYSGRTYAEGKKITWRDGLRAIFYLIWFRFFD